MNSEPLRLGSRRSPMAITQSGNVARLITERLPLSDVPAALQRLGDGTTAGRIVFHP